MYYEVYKNDFPRRPHPVKTEGSSARFYKRLTVFMKMSAQVIEGMKRHFKDYKPDHEPKKAAPLPGKEQKHGENTGKSTYVWLPIEWEGEKPVIRWHDEWRLEDY